MTKLKFSTNLGQFSVLLNEEKAPNTCKNFLEYVKAGSYNNVIFHRVIKGFMAQAGTMNMDGSERSCNPPIQNEAALRLKITEREKEAEWKFQGECGMRNAE